MPAHSSSGKWKPLTASPISSVDDAVRAALGSAEAQPPGRPLGEPARLDRELLGGRPRGRG